MFTRLVKKVANSLIEKFSRVSNKESYLGLSSKNKKRSYVFNPTREEFAVTRSPKILALPT